MALMHGEQWNIGFSDGWDAHKKRTEKNEEEAVVDEDD